MRRIRLVTALLLTWASCILVGHAEAQPVLGALETFTTSGVGGWDGQGTLSNPGTGGVDGAADGYLMIASGLNLHLGARNDSSAYAGNWIAANANRVRFFLNDVGADQDLEIHFVIGTTSNMWQYNTGFLPPDGSWAEFTVDLTSAANFTHTINFFNETFTQALTGANRILIRHDHAPYTQTPDLLDGEFGLDNVLITNPLVGVGPDVPGGAGGPAAGRPVWLAPPSPNPARGAVACAVETFDEGPVRLTVVDARGRVVRSASLPAAPAGRRTWMWDGRDNAGRSVAAGAYRVRAMGPGGGTSRAIVRVD